VGCWLYDGARDKHTWRGIVTGEPLMAAFKHLRAWPDETQIEELKRVLHI
jgi:hypothetical protein